MKGTSLQKSVKPRDDEVQIKVPRQIVWQNVVGFLVMHLLALYGMYVYITSATILTWMYGKYKTNTF